MKLEPITWAEGNFDTPEYQGMQEYYWYCPGCKTPHKIRTNGPHPNWTFNGDLENPTFSPSYLCGAHASNLEGKITEKFARNRCHSFIENGMIRYLTDCYHEYAGQTIPLPEIPDWLKSD